MYQYDIRIITKAEALAMIQAYHYSNTLPKLNKYFLGFYLNNKLVGVVTLGYGTRPLHTIKKLFPSLVSQDYLEIGRMCMLDSMPRNSESQMLSQLIKWLKVNRPEVKVLFTWADGMLGKCGYVYQASNFVYCGASMTDMYMYQGAKIHVRQTRALFRKGVDDKRITIRPTKAEMLEYGVDHYKGYQFKYIYFLCNKRVKKILKKECLVDLHQANPKEKDLCWKKQNLTIGKWQYCDKPPYITDNNKELNIHRKR